MRALPAVALCTALLGGAFPSWGQATGETPPAPGRDVQRLSGVDLTLPAPDAFRGWPPEELRTRPYWLPWTGYAFTRARLFQRPVLFFMSAPWNRFSQRMQEETLADPRVVALANQGYLAIAVRADRRPDIQERYQTGSWPVVAFLLPDGKPMLSQANQQGVALPITTGYVTPDAMAFLLEQGLIYFDRWSSLLQGVGTVWKQGEGGAEPVAGPAAVEGSDSLARWLLGNADRQQGGFGAAPKYPVASLVEYARLRDARLVPALFEHADLTLDRLLASPLYDKREGGVHRLAASTDWGGIQYEKMLDRNAALVRDLVFALRGGASPARERALRETAGWIVRVLGRPGGGFALSQFADPSSPDGGRHWTAPAGEAPPPPVDTLVLSGPNAMAGAALLRAGALLADDGLADAGRGAIELVLGRAYERARGVDHVIEPQPEDRRYLTAQADVALGVVDAYEATGDPRHLAAARDVAEFTLRHFRAGEESALRDLLPEAQPLGLLDLPRRPMTDNVRLARALLRLAIHTGDAGFRSEAERIVSAYAGEPTLYRVAGTELALAIEEIVREPLTIRIDGAPADAATRALRRSALAVSWPWTIVTTGSADQGAAAVVSWRGETRRVERAGDLDGAVRQLSASGAPGVPGR